MKLIIDVPEERYTDIQRIASVQLNKRTPTIEQIIANGTPLPKGHGRLIDADALDLEKEVSMADDWKTAHEIANCVKYAPTIIEADMRGEADEDNH